MLSPRVNELIAKYREEGYSVLLATAASELYVPWIWEGPYIATAYLSDQECRGDEKKRRALDYAHHNNMVIRAAATDHSDDVPLLSIGTLEDRFLISPSCHTIEAFAKAGISAELISHR